jgi:cytochrome P450
MIEIETRKTHSRTGTDFASDAPAVMRDENGVWHVRGYAEARAILLGDAVQAGFNAELVKQMPVKIEDPVLFQDGAGHREQRAQIAKFFTPTFTQQHHTALMEKYADEIVGDFVRAGGGDLNKMTARMAMAVAADLVGLTNSNRARMAERLDTILHADMNFGMQNPRRIYSYLHVQWNMVKFYLADVRPAIQARKHAPQSDVISHLVSKKRSGTEILIECITYGAAGMVTTQEFICLATWQMLRHPELRTEFSQGDQETRYRVLHELLRLDPVVAHLLRRAASDISLGSNGTGRTIPRGALIDLHLNEINADARAAGAEPLFINPHRTLEKNIPRSLMGFGSGPHRCVGEFIALAESDVFLLKLMQVQGLRIVREPTILRNETIKGYELRNFILTIDS